MEPWTFAPKSSVLRRLGAAAAAAAADAAADAAATKEQLHRERRLERLGLQKDACDELVVSMLRLLLQSGRPGLGGPGAQPVLRRKLERRPVRVLVERREGTFATTELHHGREALRWRNGRVLDPVQVGFVRVLYRQVGRASHEDAFGLRQVLVLVVDGLGDHLERAHELGVPLIARVLEARVGFFSRLLSDSP